MGFVDVIVYLPICFGLSVCSCVAAARACLYDRRALADWYTSKALKRVLMGFAGWIAVRWGGICDFVISRFGAGLISDKIHKVCKESLTRGQSVLVLWQLWRIKEFL